MLNMFMTYLALGMNVDVTATVADADGLSRA